MANFGAVHCAATNEVLFDEALGRVLYDDFGDFAVGYVIGLAWAEAVQAALGSTLEGEARALASDCLVGAWIGTRIDFDPDTGPATTAPPTERHMTVSPGDLDEAVQTALVVGDRGLERRPRRERLREDRGDPPRGAQRLADVSRRDHRRLNAAPAGRQRGRRRDGHEPSGEALAALDIGTNSIHLVVARPVSGDRFETLTRETRGRPSRSGGGDMKLLTPEALERGLACLDADEGDRRRVRRRAPRRRHQRDPRSGQRPRVHRPGRGARRASAIEVISGVEEARLIHLGVLQAVPVFDRRLLLVDVGGGSTELLIGECGETLAARSLKVGAVRLTDRFFPGGKVAADAVKACRNHVRNLIEHFHREVTTHGFEVAVASSGTAETVARIAHALTGAEPLRTYNCFEFSRDALDDVVARLVKHRTASARTKVPGLEAHRADIIVAGALILATIAETFDVDVVPLLRGGAPRGRAARHDQPDGRGGSEIHHLRDVSRRSIHQLVERCDDDPAHSIHVARLAVALFDAIPELRALGPAAREYLEAGALLANVGLVVAHSQHHLHAYYVIRNSELAGLTDNEIEVIAQIARYHRKSEPKQSHADLRRPVGGRSASRALARRRAAGGDRPRSPPRRPRRPASSASADERAGSSSAAIAADGSDIGLEVFAAGERSALLARVLERDGRGRRRLTEPPTARHGRGRRNGRRRRRRCCSRRRRWGASAAASAPASGRRRRRRRRRRRLRGDRGGHGRRRRVVDVVVVV